jgi:drug/metabolite transporter (DMT)-like permease
MSKTKTQQGIAWMVLTGILFTAVTGIVRHVGSDLPSIEAAFIRYAIGSVLIAPLIVRQWNGLPDRGMLKIYTIRGIIHGVAVMLWFYAMARIPIAEVTAIGYLAPIFVTIGAGLFLGEKIHLRRMVSIFVGFGGTLIILRPGFESINLGQLAQLSAAPLFAASFLIAKKLTSREDIIMIVGMLSVFCTLFLLPGALLVWKTPTYEQLVWLAMTAVFATAGHYALTRAFQASPITVTQPVSFLQLVWAIILGATLFDEAVDPFVILGGAVIVISTSYIAHREIVIGRSERITTEIATKL